MGCPDELDGPVAEDYPVYVAEAEGARFTDVDGNTFVDFCLGDTGGMAGHAPPATVEGDRAPGVSWHHHDAAYRGCRMGER